MAILVLEKIVIMFLILLVGVWCFKKKLLDENVTVKLSGFLLQVVNPLVIFVSYQMEYDKELLHRLLLTLLLSVIGFVVQILVVHLLIGKKSGMDVAIERLSAIYGNCGFIGIPLINGLFGREGVFFMTAYLTVFYLFFWTHGVILMTGKMSKKETVKNLFSPAIIGVVLGLLCFVFQLMLPKLIVETMDSIGSMNTPLAMLVAGATLGQSDLLECLKRKRIYYICFLKLILMPMLMLLLFFWLKLPTVIMLTLVLASGCPVGACCTMFALRYEKDGKYASQMFALSTLVSAVTLPVLIFVAEAAGIM